MEYTKIKSAYILERLKKTSWEDHAKIDGLIQLHEYIVRPPKTFNGGQQFMHLQHLYPGEYLALLEEDSPEALKLELSRRAEAEEYLRMRKESDAQELEKAKKEWLRIGGRP